MASYNLGLRAGAGRSTALASFFALSSAAVALSWSTPSSACGGCFGPVAPAGEEPSLVTGHRMAFSVNDDRTVLWDQFDYSGSPEDFAWVLPVRPGAFVEVSSQAWLEALDEFTQPEVYGPPVSCGFNNGLSGGDFSCGCSDDAAEQSGNAGGSSGYAVTVVSQQVVGPYDTVILKSSDPEELELWLSDNDYVLPPEIGPVIAAYVEEGYHFLALRLSPGQGVNQMEPVRVTTPKGPPRLPLRMVAAGTGNEVAMTLFVLGEGRQAISDLVDFQIDDEDLTFDYATNEGDYQEVADSLFDKADGHVQITSFASARPFISERSTPIGAKGFNLGVRGSFYSTSRLDEYFFLRAWNDLEESGELVSVSHMNDCLDKVRNYELTQKIEPRCGDVPCPSPFDWGGPAFEGTGVGGAGGEEMSLGGALNLGGDSGSGSAGPDLFPALPEQWDPTASFNDYPEQEAGAYTCGPFTDLEAALTGQVPSRLWLTRLDMKLPRSALEMDCEMLSSDAGPVSGIYTAGNTDNHPCPPSAGGATASVWGSSSRKNPLHPVHLALWGISLTMVLTAGARRALRPASLRRRKQQSEGLHR